MEAQFIKNMARYIELSEKFSKSEREIFTEDEIRDSYSKNTIIDGGGISIGGTCVSTNSYTTYINDREIIIDEDGVVRVKDNKPISRGQQLEIANALKIKSRGILLDEYDEFIMLRRLLKAVFKSIDDLNKNKNKCTCGPNEGCSNCTKRG